jgi:flagellar biosynthesis protein FliQ
MTTVCYVFLYYLPLICAMVLPILFADWLLEQITEYNTRKARRNRKYK